MNKLKVRKCDIELFLILVGICIPQGIAGVGVVSKISTFIKLIAFLNAGILLLKKKVKPDMFFWTWMIYLLLC